jgi:hypothetical protein
MALNVFLMKGCSIEMHRQFRIAGGPAQHLSGEQQLLIRALLTGNRWFDSIPAQSFLVASLQKQAIVTHDSHQQPPQQIKN